MALRSLSTWNRDVSGVGLPLSEVWCGTVYRRAIGLFVGLLARLEQLLAQALAQSLEQDVLLHPFGGSPPVQGGEVGPCARILRPAEPGARGPGQDREVRRIQFRDLARR